MQIYVSSDDLKQVEAHRLRITGLDSGIISETSGLTRDANIGHVNTSTIPTCNRSNGEMAVLTI